MATKSKRECYICGAPTKRGRRLCDVHTFFAVATPERVEQERAHYAKKRAEQEQFAEQQDEAARAEAARAEVIAEHKDQP